MIRFSGRACVGAGGVPVGAGPAAQSWRHKHGGTKLAAQTWWHKAIPRYDPEEFVRYDFYGYPYVGWIRSVSVSSKPDHVPAVSIHPAFDFKNVAREPSEIMGRSGSASSAVDHASAAAADL